MLIEEGVVDVDRRARRRSTERFVEVILPDQARRNERRAARRASRPPGSRLGGRPTQAVPQDEGFAFCATVYARERGRFAGARALTCSAHPDGRSDLEPPGRDTTRCPRSPPGEQATVRVELRRRACSSPTSTGSPTGSPVAGTRSRSSTAVRSRFACGSPARTAAPVSCSFAHQVTESSANGAGAPQMSADPRPSPGAAEGRPPSFARCPGPSPVAADRGAS